MAPVSPQVDPPVTTINPPQTPVAGPVEPAGSWSLFNLLATILAVILLIVFFIKYFFDRSKEEFYEEEPLDAQLWAALTPEQRAQYQARRAADYQTWLSERQRDVSRHKVLYVNAPVLLIVGAALVEALVVLFLTQDFGEGMLVVDNWSVLFALIIFIQLFGPMVAAAIHNSRRVNQQRLATAQPPVSISNPTD